MDAVGLAAQNACHWIVTATYLRVALETKLLIPKDTEENVKDKLDYVNRLRFLFNAVNTFVASLIVALSVCYYLALVRESNLLKQIALTSSLVFQMACVLAWGCTLIKIYREVKQTKKLLPNKRVFTLHGCLLILYLVFYSAERILTHCALHTHDLTKFYIFAGVVNIMICLRDLTEMATFFLVVKMMLPFTERDKKLRSRFNQFIAKGCADKGVLKDAIVAHEAEQRWLAEPEDMMGSFYKAVRPTHYIVGSMVVVIETEMDYEYSGYLKVQEELKLLESDDEEEPEDLLANEPVSINADNNQ